MTSTRVALLVTTVAAAALAACELGLRAAPCPCATGWTCCTDSNVCVRDQTECAAYSDGGTRDAVGQEDGPQLPGDVIVTILTTTGKCGLTDIAIDETHVYWMESGMGLPDDYNAQVVRIAKTGGTPEVLTTLPPRAYLFALDATHVYVSARNVPDGSGIEGAGAIVRVSKQGGATETVLDGTSMPYAIAVDDERVYFTTSYSNTGLVVSVPKTGGSGTTLVDQMDGPWDLAVDDTHVCYSEMNAGKIRRVPKAGGAAQELASGFIGTANLSLDDSTVYFLGCEAQPCMAQTVYAVSKSGGDMRVVTPFADAMGANSGIVARSRLYLSGVGGPGEFGAIFVVPKSGGDLALVVGGFEVATALAVEPDESAAYWVSALTGEVGAVRLR